MINKVINNTINSATQTLFESKDKILTVAKKRANEEINTFQNKIPSPSALETQLNLFRIQPQLVIFKKDY